MAQGDMWNIDGNVNVYAENPPKMSPAELEHAIAGTEAAIGTGAKIELIQAKSGDLDERGNVRGPGVCRDISLNLTPAQSKYVFQALLEALNGL